MLSSEFPVNDPDRYKGYDQKSTFGRLLIQSGNIIDTAVGGRQNPSSTHWTDHVNKMECSLEATNAMYSKALEEAGSAPAAIVCYEMIRTSKITGLVMIYQWHSGDEAITILNENRLPFRTTNSTALMLDIESSLSQFDREKMNWNMPSDNGTTTIQPVVEVNAEFDKIIEYNNDFYKKLGSRTVAGIPMGRTKKYTVDRVMELTDMGYIDAEFFLAS